MTPKLWEALWQCVSETHEKINCLGCVGKELVASTDTVLVAINNHELVFPFGTYRLGYNRKWLSGPYPNIEGVFISEFRMIYSVKDLMDAAELVPRSENIPGQHIALIIERMMIYPPLLLKVLEVFRQNNERTVGVSTGNNRVQLNGEHTRAVVMALIAKDKVTRCKECYTITELLGAGDLL